ncbi:hypothetical protein FPRO04_06705 [Fusarium proliferatum]|uniref:BTB domain-containing protein n=1 Tax=Gibberella intermedia TaxID=948311 RepID=A0A420TVV6_GIBIN|nr:hypothetical protein FPRO04_06705 [Fusarium proliferatum]RKL45715.1 hypothetical protein BFJ72_g3260 [Fusarium proliferatum]
MANQRQLGKSCLFRFENTTYSIPSTLITKTGNLGSLFKHKDEYKMKDVDESTGRVFVDYIMLQTYEVDYETAEQDQDMALREYKIALTLCAIGCRYEISGLGFLAKEHAVKLAELIINPASVLVAIVDAPLALKHIPGIIHLIDEYTAIVLQRATRRVATDFLLRMDPPDTMGWLWLMLQVMQKAEGPALERGWDMVAQTLPTRVPGLIEYMQLREEYLQEREQTYLGDDAPLEDDVGDDDEVHFQPLFNHFIPSAKIKCGKVMRAMVGSINSSQKFATRNKERPAKRSRCIFIIRFISPDHSEDDRGIQASSKHGVQHLSSGDSTYSWNCFRPSSHLGVRQGM